MIVYHLTPFKNVPSILASGIEPEKSRGKRKVSWYVDGRAIIWATLHVSTIHHVPVDSIAAITLEVPSGKLKRTCWRGVYTCCERQEGLILVSSAVTKLTIQECENGAQNE